MMVESPPPYLTRHPVIISQDGPRQLALLWLAIVAMVFSLAVLFHASDAHALPALGPPSGTGTETGPITP